MCTSTNGPNSSTIARAFARVSSYGEIAAAITAPPWRVRRAATQPIRSMFVSRSSFEKPRPLERCVRTVSPSRYSTMWPRRSSSGPTRCAMVVLPAPERPVNQRVKPPRARRPTRGARVHRCGQQSCGRSCDSLCSVGVNAALELVRAGPAPGALFLVGARRPRARNAPDRPIPDVVQRVVGNLVDGDVRPDALLVPVGERMELPDAVALRPLHLRRGRTRGRLVAADARDPALVRLQDAKQRLDLADVAAAVRVALPEIRPLAPVLLGDADDVGANQLEAVA